METEKVVGFWVSLKYIYEVLSEQDKFWVNSATNKSNVKVERTGYFDFIKIRNIFSVQLFCENISKSLFLLPKFFPT